MNTDDASDSKRPLVLVIDDDEDVRGSMRDLLDGEGFATAGAANGAAALNFIADSKQRPAMILLDLNMPILDGWTFCKIRQGIVMLMAIPVIAMSAAPIIGVTGPLRVDGMLQKPFEADALTGLMTQITGRKSSHA